MTSSVCVKETQQGAFSESHAYTCRELGANGVNSLLAVPVSFVSEHIETLEEIDMEYRELAHESGIQNWGRVPALNTNPTFIDDLAEAVLEALPYVGSMAGSNPGDAMVPLGMGNTMHAHVHCANEHASSCCTASGTREKIMRDTTNFSAICIMRNVISQQRACGCTLWGAPNVCLWSLASS